MCFREHPCMLLLPSTFVLASLDFEDRELSIHHTVGGDAGYV